MAEYYLSLNFLPPGQSWPGPLLLPILALGHGYAVRTIQSVQQEEGFGARVASGLGSPGWGLDKVPEAPWRHTEDQVSGSREPGAEEQAFPVDPQGLVAGWTSGLKEKWESMTSPSLGLGRLGK